MITRKRRASKGKNLRGTKGAWPTMPSRSRAKARSEARDRAKPGATGEGEFYHIKKAQAARRRA